MLVSDGGLHFEDVVPTIIEFLGRYRDSILKIVASPEDPDGHHWQVSVVYDESLYSAIKMADEYMQRKLDKTILDEKIKEIDLKEILKKLAEVERDLALLRLKFLIENSPTQYSLLGIIQILQEVRTTLRALAIYNKWLPYEVAMTADKQVWEDLEEIFID